MQEVVETTWWLEWYAPEYWHWARLQTFNNGKAQILDCDGKYHSFNTKQDAENWLSEDEYSRYEYLIEDGEVLSAVTPPCAKNEVELVELILSLSKLI